MIYGPANNVIQRVLTVDISNVAPFLSPSKIPMKGLLEERVSF